MIQSSAETAEKIATGMGNASDSIQQATDKTIAKAMKTTLQVNQQAQQANEEVMALARLFNESFRKTIRNIQLASEEFERTDSALAGELNKLNQVPNYLEDMYTYNKAKNG